MVATTVDNTLVMMMVVTETTRRMNKLSGVTGMPMAWATMPMTLPKVVPRMRLGMTMPIGMGMVTDADVRKNCEKTTVRACEKEEKKRGDVWGTNTRGKKEDKTSNLVPGRKGVVLNRSRRRV